MFLSSAVREIGLDPAYRIEYKPRQYREKSANATRSAGVTFRGLQVFRTLLAMPAGDARTTSAAAAPRWWWLLALLAPLYMVLAAILPPADDELYYWCWSKTLQFSYYDHPGMSAYMIRVATTFFGDSLFALRLPAVLASLVVVGVIGYLTRPRRILPLVVITPLFTFGAVIITPDTPLRMFWALYLAWMVKVHERLAEPNSSIPIWLWTVGGVVAGCGVLGKYTMALGMMAGFASFVLAGQWRRWILGYVLHGVVAFLVASPILIHNIRHEFVPILYQWKHSMSSPEPGFQPFAEFTGIQLLLFGTTPFWIFAWAVRKRRDLLADPRLRVCFCLFVLPFAFFLWKATRGRLEGNWALACYIALWPLAAAWYETVRASLAWRRLTVSAFIPPLICVFVVGVHLVHPLPILTPNNDRITRQAVKLEIARELARILPEHQKPGEPLFTLDYQWTALLRFAGAHAYQVDGLTRPSHFTLNDAGPAPKMYDTPQTLLWTEGLLPPVFTQGMGPPQLLAEYPLYLRGKHITTYWLLRYTKTPGP
jgi:hypothetical protein